MLFKLVHGTELGCVIRAGKWPGNHFSLLFLIYKMLSPEILHFNSFVLLLETSFSVNLFPFSIQESVEKQLETTKLGSLPTRWSESWGAGRAPPSSEGLLDGTERPSPSLDLEELGAHETSLE